MKLNEGFDEELFTQLFGDGADNVNVIRKFKSPGRVNIIGEHTDYNGGYVFPCTLDFGTYALARKRMDNVIKLSSKLFDGVVEITTNNLEYDENHNWANYVKGVIKEFIKAGYGIGGFELLIDSNMPLSSGLSSSASLEVLVSKVLSSLFELNVTGVDMAILSQKAENNYMGVNCGIMDQFIIANGEKGKAMLLNCDTLEYKQCKLDLKNYKIVICNTKKPRNLVESKYNERLAECREGFDEFKKYVDISYLAQLTVEQFEEHKHKVKNTTVVKRVEHVVYETKRTLESVKLMESGDLISLGKNITSSHNSLKDLYEVTGVELDTIVKLALEQEGVLGARMTGAGFGGCAISLVREDLVENFIKNVGNEYYKEVNLTAEFYIANIGNGVEEL